jgi:hypothetical protein
LAFPFHGSDDVTLLCLELSGHCHKMTSWFMNNGTVAGWGLGLWLPASRYCWIIAVNSCPTMNGSGEGSFPFTARPMLSPVQKMYVQSVHVCPEVEVRVCKPAIRVVWAPWAWCNLFCVCPCTGLQQLMWRYKLGAHSIINGKWQTEASRLRFPFDRQFCKHCCV